MDKVEFYNIVSGTSIQQVNANFDIIKDVLNNQVLYRNNPENTPNQVSNDLDMNSKRILNLPAPVNLTDPVRLVDLGIIDIGVVGALPSVPLITDVAIIPPALVYVKPTGRIGLADASAEGKEAVGVVVENIKAGSVAKVNLVGSLISGLSGLVPGASYYMSLTPGVFTTYTGAPTTPGNVLMKVGTALTPNSLIFCPEIPITL